MLTIPSGGASISVTTTAKAATTVTLPAASYYATTAGGVSGWVSTLQDLLNQNSMGFPTTAVTTGTAIGYGNFTTGAGWLMQEASGSLAPVFGSPSLTAVSSPTYRNAGIKTGDYAIGFDSAADQFDGGNNFDVIATDDLVVAWVGYVSANPAASSGWFGKGVTPGWYIFRRATGEIAFTINNAVSTSNVAVPQGEWHVGIAVIERGTNRARCGVCGLTSGTVTVSAQLDISAQGTLSNASSINIGSTYGGVAIDQDLKVSAFYITDGTNVATNLSANLSTALATFRNAINAAWTCSMSTTTGLVSLNWSGYTGASYLWSVAWTSTALRDLAGYTADITSVITAQTGTYQARGVWFPDCPLNLDGDPTQAPLVSDLRQSESPTGIVLGLVSNMKYRHRGVSYPAVPRAQVWDSAATYENGSWEEFMLDTQLGQGHSWFVPSSRIQLYWDSAGTQTLLGSAANSSAGLSGWFIKGASSIEPKLTAAPWTGLWRIDLGELVSNG